MVALQIHKPPVLVETPAFMKTAKGYHKITCEVVKVFNNTVRFVHATVYAVPESVHRAIKGVKFLNGIDVLLDFPALVNELYAAKFAPTAFDLAQSALRSLVMTSSLIKSSINVTDGLKDFGLIAKESLLWTEFVVKILYPLSVVRTVMCVQAFQEASKEYRTLEKRIKPGSRNDLIAACKAVIELKEIIYNRLQIRPETGLDARTNEVLRSLRQKESNAIENAKNHIRKIRRKITISYCLDLAYVVTRVSACATVGITVCFRSSPVVLAVATATSMTGLALLGTRFVLIKSDPFGPPKDEWYHKLLHTVRERFYAELEKYELIKGEIIW